MVFASQIKWLHLAMRKGGKKGRGKLVFQSINLESI